MQYAIAAAEEAFTGSGLSVSEAEQDRVGVITGCGMGGLPTIEQTHQVCLEKGPRRITPFLIPRIIPNMPSGHISMRFHAKGPNLALTTACAAGTHAVGEAFRSIAYGDCDMAITGGAESVICPLAVGGFGSMKALSTRNDEPGKASRPFDRDRDGFVISEGSGMIMLEELEHARRRGATIYAEMARLRPDQRCLSHRRPAGRRRGRSTLHETGPAGCGHESGGHRLYQCPRHFDAAQ